MDRLAPDDYMASVLAFDASSLARWVNRHGTHPAVDVARLWLALQRGGTEQGIESARTLYERASREGRASVVIEATVLRALCAASVGDLPEALASARRACRMAQAEASPDEECLAHLVLARIRRYTGHPHLTLHILTALSRVAPPRWHPWIAWEMLLCGGEARARALVQSDGSPAMRAVRSLGELLAAARSGDRGRFDASAAALPGALAGWCDLAREAAALVAALDVLARPALPDVLAWCTGESPALPAGLHGIAAPQDLAFDEEGAVAYVVARPGETGRRVLGPGLGLSALAPTWQARGTSDATAGRIGSGLAALALAGPAGITRENFFAKVYGFRFVSARHRGVLDVLVHRMRERLEGIGEITRSSDDLSLAILLRAPIVVPDVRSALPVDDRVLRAVATFGAASAQDAAQALRLPLRTVQNALQRMVADGSCALERQGRHVTYRVLDTTFTSMTPADRA